MAVIANPHPQLKKIFGAIEMRPEIEKILAWHQRMRPEILRRLAEFRKIGESGSDEEIFAEMCFCIFAAGTSAVHGGKCVGDIRDILMMGNLSEFQERLHKNHRRFWRRRAEFVVKTRDYLRKEMELKLRERLRAISEPMARRDFLAENKFIKGIGYKEASHFLRNIGFRGYAILDVHILKSMREIGVIRKAQRPANRKNYIRLEGRFHAFAKSIGIDSDELDLVLWSLKTGQILK